MDKYIGRLLDNRYEILEIIGTGGMAVVYKARCHRLNRLVAIKILKSDYLEDEDFRSRFHAESQAVAMLSHPNIVSVYDVSTSVSLEADYIVMELIEGITLKQYMEKKGFLNWKETLHFAMQIAKALEHAHSRGIVHRDIKPHNVMVLKNGSVKVTDFGIARMMSKGNTLTKEALGSVHYISPEQAKGGRVDNRSDIYSLGVVMYEMMSGRPPFDGDSPVAVAIQHINGGAPMPSTLNPNIPGGLEQIIMKAMALDTADRYASAAQMLVDMDDFRKDPTMLFDYNLPPTDAVLGIGKTAAATAAATGAPRTAAERAVSRSTGSKRTGQTGAQRGAAAAGAVARNGDRRTSTTGRTSAQRSQEAQRRREEEEASRNRVAIIAIIICAVVAVLSIVIVLILWLGGNSETNLIEIPKLIGEDYYSLEAYPDLQIKLLDEVYDEEAPAGTILGQDPEAGTQVEPGRMVFVTVSLGKEPKSGTMSDLTGYTLESAQSYLDRLNMELKVTPVQEYSDEIEEGKIIRTEPAFGGSLEAGQEVKLYVSLGMEIRSGLMPNVLDIDEATAISRLENQNLKLNIITEPVFDSDIAVGNVVDTDPQRGDPLQTGQTVTLYISKGPETAQMPDLVNKDLEVAKSLLEYAGFGAPKIDYQYSELEEGTVISQSEVKNTQVEITKVITLTVSKGPEPTEPPEVTMDVTIDLKGYASTTSCAVEVYCDTVLVFSQTVEAGTEQIVLEDQKGVGLMNYVIVINGADNWEQWVEFA